MKYRIVALICALSMSLSLVTPAMAAETPYDNVTDIVVSEVVEDENGKELKAAAETPVVAEGECGDNLMWSLDEKRVLSISGTGKMYDYFSSNAPWYEYRSEIKKIELNVGITKIGAYAFSGCMATGDLIIPNGVTEIGEFAFRSCSGFTGKLVLPNTLTKIYGNAFDGCRNLCGILELPDNVTEIRDAAFSDCRGITGVVFPSELTKITAAMFNGCSGLSGTIIIPVNVTKIETEAFNDCTNIEKIVIKNKETVINQNNYLLNPVFPEQAIISGYQNSTAYDYAIANNIKFECIDHTFEWVIDKEATETETGLKHEECTVCGYKQSENTVVDKVEPEEIGGICGEGLTWLLDAEGTLTISGTGWMNHYNDTDNQAPWKAYSTDIKSLVIEEGVYDIGAYAFSGCTNLVGELILPSTVGIIYEGAFADCTGLSGELVLSKDLMRIYKGAFSNCSGLTGTVLIPENVNYIGENAFSGVENIEKFVFTNPEKPVQIKQNAIPENAVISGYPFSPAHEYSEKYNYIFEVYRLFEGTCGENLTWSLDENGVLSISGSGKMYDYYSSNAPWYKYRSKIKKIELDESITKIGAYAFSGCMATGDLIIPNGVTEIGESAFRSCSGFTGKLVLPNTLNKIGPAAFEKCLNLSGILELPDNLTEIGDFAFCDCQGITGFVFPKDLTIIPGGMFAGCSGLEGTIVIPSNIIFISPAAFEGCKNIEKFVFENKETEICSESNFLPEQVVICGYQNSMAYAYAVERGHVFECIDHTFEWIIDKDATETETGLKHEECTVCGYKQSENTVVDKVEPEEIGGTCGENLSWILDENGTLIISGTGPMEDYDYAGDAPWYNYSSQIKGLVLNKGITKIGDYAFEGLDIEGSVTIPNGVTGIGQAAFFECKGLDGELTLPNTLTYLGALAFAECSNLSGTLELPDSLTDKSYDISSFLGCTGFTGLKLSSKMTTIPEKMFAGWKALTGTIVIPANIISLGNDAFKYCTNIEKFVFKNSKIEIALVNGHLPEQAIISGYQNSTAYNYAVANNMKFECLDHTFEWIIDKEAVGEATGLKHEKCKVCGYKRNENTIIDIAKPKIDESTYTISQTSAEVGDKIRIAVKITDNVGVNYISIRLFNPVNNKEKYCYMNYNPETDLYEYELEIDEKFSAGEWEIDYIYAQDKSGNYAFMNPVTTINVDNPNIDSLPPEIDIDSFTVDHKFALVGDSVVISVKAKDNVGVDYLDIRFENLDTKVYESSNSNKMSYNETMDTYEYVFEVDENTEIGHWEIYRIYAYDKEENYSVKSFRDHMFVVGDYEEDFGCEVDEITIESGKYVDYEFTDLNGYNSVRMLVNDNVEMIRTEYGHQDEMYFTHYKCVAFDPGEAIVEIMDSSGKVCKVFKINVVPAEETLHINEDISIWSNKNQSYKAYVDEVEADFVLKSKKGYSPYSYIYTLNFDSLGEKKVRIVGDDGKEIIINADVIDHSFSTEWSADEDKHWYECSCGLKREENYHEFEWIIDKEAVGEETGLKHKECKVCGDKRNIDTVHDTAKPKIDESTFTISQTSAEVGDKIRIAVKITDNVGLDYTYIRLFNPVNNKEKYCYMNYNPETDLYEYELEIDEKFSAGEWKFDYICARDKSGNYAFIHPVTTINVDNPNVDSLPPEIDIDSLTVDHKFALIGDSVVISVKAKDNVGVDYLNIRFENLDTKTYESLKSNKMTYNESKDLYEYVFIVDESTEIGHWQIDEIYAYDKEKNCSVKFVSNYLFVVGDYEKDFGCEIEEITIESGKYAEFDLADAEQYNTVRIIGNDNVEMLLDKQVYEEGIYHRYYKCAAFDLGETVVEVLSSGKVVKVYKINVIPSEMTTHLNQDKEINILSQTEQTYEAYVDNEPVELEKLSDSVVYYHSYTYALNLDSLGEKAVKIVGSNGKEIHMNVNVIDHSFASEFSSDENDHWYACACGAKKDETSHTFEWITDKDATEEETGLKHEKCTVCSYLQNENTVIDKLPHTHDMEFVPANVATCEVDGNIAYYICKKCDKLYANEEGEKEYTAEEVVIKPTHTMQVTYANSQTCEEDGNIEYYTCTKCKKIYKEKAGITELKAEDILIPAHGHSYYEWYTFKEATYSNEGISIRECKYDPKHQETKPIDRLIPEEVNINTSSVLLLEGESYQFTGSAAPYPANTEDMTWSSSNNSVATIDSSGRMTTVSTGKAIITLSIGGMSATCEVDVRGGIDKGTCDLYGNLYWILDKDGILTITGNGAIPDYYHGFEEYKNIIRGIRIEEGVTGIGSQTFNYFPNISGELVLPNSLKRIGDMAFQGCGFTGELKLPEGLEYIGNQAFRECKGFTGDLIIPETVTKIGACAFDSCFGFNGQLILPSGLKNIEAEVFQYCSGLTGKLVLPKSVEIIYAYAFRGCSGLGGTLEIPEGVKRIEYEAFADCTGIEKVVFSEGIQSIGGFAFARCTNIKGEIILPESLNRIEYGAFENCVNLSKAIFLNKGCMISDMYDPLLFPEKVVIAGHDGSIAEMYAENTNRTFIDINTGEITNPDDGNIEDNPPEPTPPEPTPPVQIPFTDVRSTDWFHESAGYVYSHGLMTGMTPTTFGPAINLSRAQFAVILWRMNGSPTMDFYLKFPDVHAGTWYADAVMWASERGIITGYSHNGLFGAADNITREQMALMMYRYANSKGYDTGEKADFGRFKDASKVSGFAIDGMQWAVGKSIITGKENGTAIDPQGNASRAECATIIMRFMKAYEE